MILGTTPGLAVPTKLPQPQLSTVLQKGLRAHTHSLLTAFATAHLVDAGASLFLELGS